MKCHWCSKELEIVNKSSPNYLECPEMHAIINLAPPKMQDINEYVLYHDILDIRYKIVGLNGVETIFNKLGTHLYKRIGSYRYVKQLSINYLPLKIIEDTINMEPLLNKLKKLIIFS